MLDGASDDGLVVSWGERWLEKGGGGLHECGEEVQSVSYAVQCAGGFDGSGERGALGVWDLARFLGVLELVLCS